ncbi:hypothetical protein [Caballeronia hypogeia]|uniref:hypothetical protein n=1 Tax=Caballeronia hypogeia TaxID=1777140 RepID=UPI0012FE7153|nr:hypothetical protein [Caballeronia hypogeia]
MFSQPTFAIEDDLIGPVWRTARPLQSLLSCLFVRGIRASAARASSIGVALTGINSLGIENAEGHLNARG